MISGIYACQPHSEIVRWNGETANSYPEGGFTTQPRVADAHPGNQATQTLSLPRRGCTTLVLHLIQRFQRSPSVLSPFPGCAAASLGCVVKPLRGPFGVRAIRWAATTSHAPRSCKGGS